MTAPPGEYDGARSAVVLPGAILGLLGGGQLGRYFTMAARAAGYEVWVLDPDPAAPAAHFATRHLCAPFDDAEALDQLGRHCAAITTEFENAPAAALQRLADDFHLPVRPSASAVAIAQDRIREKQFFVDAGLPVGAHAAVRTLGELPAALACLQFPAIIKTARFGYDGKGQVRVDSAAEANRVLRSQPEMLPCMIEARLDLALELSVILGRGVDGTVRCFPVAENRHRHGILDVSITPARIQASLAATARQMATELAERLDYVGVLAVEFFVLRDGSLLLNEMAPRPHNSGHFSIDAGTCSQFEQQVRLVCGFPPADPSPATPAVMINLLGDIWQAGCSPDWDKVLRDPQARLHLYGKSSARPGRKMGHLTVLGEDAEAIVTRAEFLRAQLGMTD